MSDVFNFWLRAGLVYFFSLNQRLAQKASVRCQTLWNPKLNFDAHFSSSRRRFFHPGAEHALFV
ncbi:MAG: hypothetical protein V4793_01895 [Paraburkholderia tropica]